MGLAGPLRPANLADWLGGGFTLRWCGKATAWKGKARSSNGRQLRVDEVIAELDTGRVVPVDREVHPADARPDGVQAHRGRLATGVDLATRQVVRRQLAAGLPDPPRDRLSTSPADRPQVAGDVLKPIVVLPRRGSLFRSRLTRIPRAARRRLTPTPYAERQGLRPVVVQPLESAAGGRTAGRSAPVLPQGFPQFLGMAASQSAFPAFLLSGPLCYTIPQTPSFRWERQGVCAASPMTESTRAGVSVGSYVRVVRPSPLEGLTGTVTFVNDSDGLYEVRVDGGRWRGRPPILVTRDEVELVP